MKKTLIIALCCFAIMVAACKKTPDPTPDPNTDYSELYVGNYQGQLVIFVTGTLTQGDSIIPVNDPMRFPFDDIAMQISKGNADNVVNMTVTIDNETYEASGSATAKSAVFERVPLNLDKPGFVINGDIQLVTTPTESDTLNLGGDFKGSGTATFSFLPGEYDINATGTVDGKLVKQ